MGASLPLPPPRTDWLDPDNEPELALVANRTAKLVPVEADVSRSPLVVALSSGVLLQRLAMRNTRQMLICRLTSPGS